MSRAKTKRECRQEIYDGMKNLCHYWSSQKQTTERERMESLCFSILVMIDGSSGQLPIPLTLSIDTCPDIKSDVIKECEDWFEPGMAINDDCQMHDEFYK